jgi:hypothetical protein
MMQRVNHPLTRGSSSSVWTAPGLHAHWPVGLRDGHSLAASSVSDLLDMSSFGFVLSTPRITKSLLRSFYMQFPTFLAGCSLTQRGYCIGEGPEYTPFSHLRSVPEAEGTGRKSQKGLYLGPYPM